MNAINSLEFLKGSIRKIPETTDTEMKKKEEVKPPPKHRWYDFKLLPTTVAQTEQDFSEIVVNSSDSKGKSYRRHGGRRGKRRGPPSIRSLMKAAEERRKHLSEQIKNQIEYYFGDENFPRDKHLRAQQLGLDVCERLGVKDKQETVVTTGSDTSDAKGKEFRASQPDASSNTGWIALDEIFTFKKMRIILCPLNQTSDANSTLYEHVQTALAGSSVVVISECGKYARRRSSIR
eukprot:CAMPEP_0197535638 /NCGR_PEP_ID=MMETSP1318-20131121/51235_1 /TAXON_ID=552666 /ORGANISM="Partenskyella glossopodia, Strain RCC365" /LENGTH=233 /DNA_ID=CAMNT_0043093271 /DNA_START=156 /DNA_END=860 /DNA_ORIENTATION=-